MRQPHTQPQPTSLAVIDASLPDLATLYRALPPDLPVYWLAAEQDGVQALCNRLASQPALDRLHLITHGAPGRIFLSNQTLSLDRLSEHQALLDQIGRTLGEQGDYVYAANGGDGIRVMDITNLSNTFVRYVDQDGAGQESKGVAQSGNYLYLADGGAGLRIFDVSTNPDDPSLTGEFNTSGDARKVAVSGNYAYVADGAAGLQIINVSTPASPTSTATFATTGDAMNVIVDPDFRTGI